MQTVIINGVSVNIPDGASVSDEPAKEAETKITKLAFRNRFTFAEKVAIETAAEADPAVRVLLKDQEAATFIDLSRTDTQNGVQLLVTKSLLTAERADVILSLDINDTETFRG